MALSLATVALVALLSAGAAHAQYTLPPWTPGTIMSQATLAPVAAATASLGTGSVKLLFVPGGTSTIIVKLAGNLTDVTMAHFHQAVLPTNGPIKLGVLPFVNTGSAVKLNPPLSYKGTVVFQIKFTAVDLVAWSGGLDAPAAEAAFMATLKVSGFYFNVHTNSFPGGEIQGMVICKRGC